MRLRKQDANGDFMFGDGAVNYWADQPEAVGQLIKTRLLLWQGEFFLDTTDGTPWEQEILGSSANSPYNLLLKSRIAQTQGVTSIESFSSTNDRNLRSASVQATVYTQYSTQPLIVNL